MILGNGVGRVTPAAAKAATRKFSTTAKTDLLAREAHLQIDLRELKLAVGAEILVAEAAGDLEVAVEAADHEDLLEDLRRLRQGVELAGMDAAGNEEVAGALGCGLGEDGGLDLEKALLAERLADGEGDVVAQTKVTLHLGAAKVDVAILEAGFFVLDGFFRRRERRLAGVVEDEELGGLDFDFAGGHFGVDGVLGAQADLADGGDDVLGADLLAFERGRRA